MESPLADAASAAAFLRYARRRSLLMLWSGIVGVVVGAALAGIAVQVAVLLVVVGLVLVLGGVGGRPVLREARRALAGPAQPVELRSWPYRTFRAPVNNRVLVTLDHPGSTERSPLVEVRATWFTPGAAESGVRACRVYGSLIEGQVVLAVADDGSCFAGRVTRLRG